MTVNFEHKSSSDSLDFISCFKNTASLLVHHNIIFSAAPSHKQKPDSF